MNKNKFDIFFNINSSTMNVGVFDNKDGKNIFFKDFTCETNLNNKKLNFNELEKIIETNVFEIEKITKVFLNEIYLMIDTKDAISINLSLSKDNEGNLIQKKDILYLIQDARQQILRAYKDQNIIHILVTNYIIDQIEYDNLPNNKNCKNFSLDIKFICMPNFLIRKMEELFNKHQIHVKKFVCSSYAKSILSSTTNNICQAGYNLVQGANKQEVVLIPKKLEKKGFFERLFYLFR